MPFTPKARRTAPHRPARVRRAHPSGQRHLWIIGVGIILLVSVLRAIHLGFPLERDEGEFGYIAQEMLRGVPMYDSAYTQKLPGTYLLYALFLSLFGQSVTAIHLGLLLANAVIMGLVYLTLRKTHNALAGCVGALVFGIMALSPAVLGFAAHATFFVALFAIAGLYALLCARERDRTVLFLASGLCFGLAFLMKQSGIFFAPLALVVLAADHLALKPRRPARFAVHALAFAAGSLAPVLLTSAYYVAIGKFALFWFWTYQTAAAFSGQVGIADAVGNLREQIRVATSGFEMLWILAMVGLVATLRDATPRAARHPYAAFAVACVLSVFPGFYFTQHYFVAVLPAVALLIGILVGSLAPGARRSGLGLAGGTCVWALIGIGLAIGVGRYGKYYFGGVSDAAVSRQIYAGSPFPESLEIGQYLRRNTTPQDRIGMLGSETQILFYAQRRSASRFVNTYFLTADHPDNLEMQREMIRDIEQSRPKYIVFVALPSSWAFGPNSSREIYDWAARYRSEYLLEGILELFQDHRVLRWGADARAVPATSGMFLEIHRRLDSGAAEPPPSAGTSGDSNPPDNS